MDPLSLASAEGGEVSGFQCHRVQSPLLCRCSRLGPPRLSSFICLHIATAALLSMKRSRCSLRQISPEEKRKKKRKKERKKTMVFVASDVRRKTDLVLKQPVVFVVSVVRRKTDLVLQKKKLWCLLFPSSGGRNISSCKQLVVFVVTIVRRRQLSSCKGPVVFVASVVRINRGQTRTSGTCSGCSLGREKEAVLLMSAAFTLQQRSLPDVHEVSTVPGVQRGMQTADLPVSKDAFC